MIHATIHWTNAPCSPRPLKGEGPGVRAEMTALRDLPPSGWPRLRTLVVRALTRRCPQCGSSGIFRNYWSLKEECPRCHYRFEREEGYFLGAYALNLLFAEFITITFLVW